MQNPIRLLFRAIRMQPSGATDAPTDTATVAEPTSSTVLWRTAVQARIDFGLPARAVPDLVRRAMGAIDSGQTEPDALVSMRRRARRMSRRYGARHRIGVA